MGGQTDTYTYQANHYNGQAHTDRFASVSGGVTGTKTFGYDAPGSVRSITASGSSLGLRTSGHGDADLLGRVRPHGWLSHPPPD